MKKLFISFAALAAMVGCSEVDEQSVNVDAKQSIALSASIAVDDTRVTVEGETFTDVKWEQGDAIKLESVAGVDAMLNATAAGDTDIRFSGEGEFVADVDTYYAVYPATDIVDATVTFDYAMQSGDDVAVLVAKREGASKDDLQMSFKPVNALLHVAVSGVESLTKAEFSAFDGSAIASTFVYDFAADATTMSGSADALVVENPAADGFFFRLPADLDMTNGYVVTLVDGAGNICSKAYNGKTFARGTTTRVEIAWSTPVVTLAVPKTSYSYYAAGDSATANSCANNVIYFDGASTYANIQNAMVAEAGFIVDGKEYAATIDTASKSFSMGNVTVSSWGAKSVEAYVKTRDGRTIKSAPETVHITGLPYTLNVTANDGNWKEEGYVNWNKSSAVRLGKNQLGGDAYIENSNFKLPENVNVVINSKGNVNGTGSWLKVENTVSISVSGSDIFSKTQKGNSTVDYTCENKACVMMASNAAVKINSSYNLEQAQVSIKSLTVTYGNK